MAGLWGMSCGRYQGHRKGQYFVRAGCEVWLCTSANKKTGNETSELKAAFASKCDAQAWAAMKNGLVKGGR